MDDPQLREYGAVLMLLLVALLFAFGMLLLVVSDRVPALVSMLMLTITKPPRM